MADTEPGREQGSSSEKAVVVVESEVMGLDVPEQDSRALHSQPASMPVSHAVTESEGTGIGGGENIADESTKIKSDAIRMESQVNNDVNEPSMVEQNSDAAVVEVPTAQQKLKDPPDEKRPVNESTTKAAFTLQDNNDCMGLTASGQKEEVTDAEVLKEECQSLQNQPESRSVSPVMIEKEGSEIGRGESIKDVSTQNISETSENESQANNVSKDLSAEAKYSPDENMLLLLNLGHVKLNLDEKQAVNESATEDASMLHVKPESLCITTETQKEEVANAEVVKEDCQVPQNHPEDTPVSHNVTELEGSETGEGQEGTMQPQLSSSEKSGDITVEIEKQQNDEQIIDDLRSEVELLKDINSQLRFEAAEVSERLGDAKMNLDRLQKILKDKDVAQEPMFSAVVAPALKDQTDTKDAEEQTSDMPSEIKAKEAERYILDCNFSNINEEMDAEIKYLVAKINKQKQEIDSLSSNNEELLKQYEAENAKNERIEEMLNNYRERMMDDQRALSEINSDKHKVVKLLEEQRSTMKKVAESMIASLSDEIQKLETVFEEHCKFIQRQLSNCTKEIEMEKQKTRSLLHGNKSMRDENDRLLIKFLSAYITSVVLEEANSIMNHRLGQNWSLFRTHLSSQRDVMERLKNKVEAREKELAARTEEMEEDIKQLNNAVDYHRERFKKLCEKYHARERQST